MASARGPGVDALADAGGVEVERRGHVAADHDGLRVEQVDRRPRAPRRAGGRSRAAARGPRRRPGAPARRGRARGRPALRRSSASRATSAQPPATVSRQPVAPQRQGSPSAASTVVCPISPAAPRWPLTHPAVGDDARARGRWRPSRPGRRRARRGAAEQLGAGQHVGVVADEERSVGDVGEVRRQLDAVPAAPSPASPRLSPRAGSTVPGRLSPMPERPAARRRSSSAASARRDLRHQLVGSDADLRGRAESEASSSPSRSSTASWLRERPTATASTTPASWLKTSAPGRPAAGGGELLAERAAARRAVSAETRVDDRGPGQPGEPAQAASGCWPGRCAPAPAARRRSPARRTRGSDVLALRRASSAVAVQLES